MPGAQKGCTGAASPVLASCGPEGDSYFLSETGKAGRLSDQQRIELRVNKEYTCNWWELTLFGELANLFSRRNLPFDSFNGHNSTTGQAYLNLDKMFLILPFLGVA